MFHRNQEGANALEFALVLPILVILIFGAFSVALGFNLRLSSAHAVRDAARYGATLELAFLDPDTQVNVDPAWLEEIRDRAIATSNGQLNSNGGAGTLVCVAFVEGELTSTNDETGINRSKSLTWTGDGTSWDTPTEEDHCFVDELDPSGDGLRIQILAQKPFDFNIVFVPLRSITITSTSIADYEEVLVPDPDPTETAGA